MELKRTSPRRTRHTDFWMAEEPYDLAAMVAVVEVMVVVAVVVVVCHGPAVHHSWLHVLPHDIGGTRRCMGSQRKACLGFHSSQSVQRVE